MRYFWRVLIAGDASSDPGGAVLPCARIECRSQRMVSSLLRTSRSLGALAPVALLAVLLGGCSLKHQTPDLVNGKKLFVAKCGSCHTLSHASTQGTVGPNLDDAFRQDRANGLRSSDIRGLVDYWIQYPSAEGQMPARLYEGQKAADVAGYVAAVAARPGQDTGALGEAVQTTTQKPVTAQNGKLQIDADPNGQLKFLASSASAKAGQVTINMKNASSVPHDIGVKGNGVNQVGSIVQNGGTSTVSISLKPGTYTFFCSVDGHEAAGMKGTLTVK
jgi:plastocyanin